MSILIELPGTTLMDKQSEHQTWCKRWWTQWCKVECLRCQEWVSENQSTSLWIRKLDAKKTNAQGKAVVAEEAESKGTYLKPKTQYFTL